MLTNVVAGPKTSVCEICGRAIPQFNFQLHRLRCSSQASSSNVAGSSPSEPSNNVTPSSTSVRPLAKREDSAKKERKKKKEKYADLFILKLTFNRKSVTFKFMNI